ncbi:MAG: hypothetical protein ACRDD1_11135 [Planctomycetia bacterium]
MSWKLRRVLADTWRVEVVSSVPQEVDVMSFRRRPSSAIVDRSFTGFGNPAIAWAAVALLGGAALAADDAPEVDARRPSRPFTFFGLPAPNRLALEDAAKAAAKVERTIPAVSRTEKTKPTTATPTAATTARTLRTTAKPVAANPEGSPAVVEVAKLPVRTIAGLETEVAAPQTEAWTFGVSLSNAGPAPMAPSACSSCDSVPGKSTNCFVGCGSSRGAKCGGHCKFGPAIDVPPAGSSLRAWLDAQSAKGALRDSTATRRWSRDEGSSR